MMFALGSAFQIILLSFISVCLSYPNMSQDSKFNVCIKTELTLISNTTITGLEM